MRAELTVKIGEIGRTSRTTVRYEANSFEFSLDESFDTLVDLVAARTTSALESYAPPTEQVDNSVYLRQAAYGSQRDLVALTPTNYRSSIAIAIANFEKRKKATGPFVCALVVFVGRREMDGNGAIRRATASRVAEAVGAVDNFLAENPDVHVGEIARSHWALTHARQPDNTPVAVPDSATFHQMQYIDRLRAQQSSNENGNDEEVELTVRLNGSLPFSLAFNVRELRRLIGLPNHNLMAEGIYHSFTMPEAPADDVQDIDHQSEEDNFSS